MYEPSIEKANDLVKKLCLDHAHRPKLLAYLDKHYLKERKRQSWMLCYRQDLAVPSIDTNNYIESWHNNLKTHFFKDRRQRRPDNVIYILVKAVIPFFQRKLNHSRLNVGRMTAVQRRAMEMRIKARNHIAAQRGRGYSGQFVYATEDDHLVLRVRSFQDDVIMQGILEGTFYTIQLEPTIDEEDGAEDLPLIVRCSCIAFRHSQECCKHIALVILEKKPMQFKRPIASWTDAEEEPMDTYVMEDAEVVVGIPPKAKKQIWRAQNNFTKELSKIVLPLHIDDSMQETVDEIQYQIQLLCEKLVGTDVARKRDRQYKKK